MVALKAADVDRFIGRPDPARPIVLVFGPDAGLVRERVEALIKNAVDDPNDPFALARIDGDELAGAPQRLLEEAHTMPLFGGRRAVWVKAGARNMTASIEALVASPPGPDCRVIIEAGDLKRTAPLRAVCERAQVAAALPCYADAERELARIIDEEMRISGLTIAPDARAALVSLLGEDRLASRSEIRKLALYAHGKGRIEMDDILAVVTDASALAHDGVADAAFAGRPQDVETQFAKALGAGTPPDVIVGVALRQAIQLHRARIEIEAGASIDGAYDNMRLHFRREKLVKTALSSWTSARLERVIAQFAEAKLHVRQNKLDLGDTIGQRALLSIAVAARRRE
jgi:DNA polymerase-3 subunit delta